VATVRECEKQQAQIIADQAQVDQAQAALVFAQEQAARYQYGANRRGQRSERPAIHLAAASAAGRTGECASDPQTLI